MTENKSLILVRVELVNISKQAPHGNPPARHEKISTSLLIHVFGLSVQVDSNVPSWVKQEVNKLQNASENNARLWKGLQAYHFPKQLKQMSQRWLFPSFILSIACQGG